MGKEAKMPYSPEQVKVLSKLSKFPGVFDWLNSKVQVLLDNHWLELADIKRYSLCKDTIWWIAWVKYKIDQILHSINTMIFPKTPTKN